MDLSEIVQWFVNLSRPNPARDWFMMSVLGGAVAVLGSALAAYLFWGIQTGSIVSASAEVPRPPIPVSREALKSVLETYADRASNYTARNFIAVTLSDPRPTKKK